ncbi:hypothetical protein ACFRCI_17345 [Streptomyces sp. NPDC056638]|uniref:hypothetical protein n=1 Tax=Streptomyces sp. NPDC056638 TaxID=3345887 RepID=UPI0036D1802B
MTKKLSRTELKEKAQEVLMHGIAKQLGYFDPNDYAEAIPASQHEELHEVMRREADRVARLFGYEKAWSN